MNTWVTNGSVYAIATTPTTTYIGGDFTYVGPNTGSGVPLSVSTGKPLPPYPRVDGYIYACVPDGSGGWYIGGSFTRVNGVTRNRIAHILPDGTLDPNWNPNANDDVDALALSGSTVYAGGGFTVVGGRSCSYFARFDEGGPTITSISPTSGIKDTTLTVTGENFGLLQGSSNVSFGNVKASSYSSWSDTKIKVKVPGGVSGKVKVTLTTAGGHQTTSTSR